MRVSTRIWFAGVILAALMSAPAWGTTPAVPGTLNYVEGQASMGAVTRNAKSVGSMSLEAGQTLTTESGKAQILMTPGALCEYAARVNSRRLA